MTTLLNQSTRDAFKKRVQSLKADTRGVWGKMSVDQMLHHCNYSLAESLGEHTGAKSIKGLPESWVRWLILNGPWGKGAPTRPDMHVPKGERHDFAKEQARMLELIERFCALPVDRAWPRTANFPMQGKHWCQLHGRHLDHHLRQFGV